MRQTGPCAAVLNPSSTRTSSPCVSNYLWIPEIHLILLEHLPADHASMVDNDVEVGPSMEFALPVGDGGERRYYEERCFNAHTIDFF